MKKRSQRSYILNNAIDAFRRKSREKERDRKRMCVCVFARKNKEESIEVKEAKDCKI